MRAYRPQTLARRREVDDDCQPESAKRFVVAAVQQETRTLPVPTRTKTMPLFSFHSCSLPLDDNNNNYRRLTLSLSPLLPLVVDCSSRPPSLCLCLHKRFCLSCSAVDRCSPINAGLGCPFAIASLIFSGHSEFSCEPMSQNCRRVLFGSIEVAWRFRLSVLCLDHSLPGEKEPNLHGESVR